MGRGREYHFWVSGLLPDFISERTWGMEGKKRNCGQTVRSQQNQNQLPSCPTPNYLGMIIYLPKPFTWLTAFQVSALNSGVPSGRLQSRWGPLLGTSYPRPSLSLSTPPTLPEWCHHLFNWAQEWHSHENCVVNQRVQLTPGYREFPSFRKAGPGQPRTAGHSSDGHSQGHTACSQFPFLSHTGLAPQPYLCHVVTLAQRCPIELSAVIEVFCPIQQQQAPCGHWGPQFWGV